MRRGKLRRPVLFVFLPVLLAAAFLLYAWMFETGARGFQAHLVIDGEPVEGETVPVYLRGDTYLAELPFTLVAEGLGCTVRREDPGAVYIRAGEKAFRLEGDRLCSEDGKLVTRVSTVPGKEPARPGERYLTQHQLQAVLELMGVDEFRVEIDPKAKLVVIARAAS